MAITPVSISTFLAAWARAALGYWARAGTVGASRARATSGLIGIALRVPMISGPV